MKSIKSIFKIFNYNRLIRSAVIRLLPKEVSSDVIRYLNKNKKIRIQFGNESAIIDNKKTQGLMPVFYWDREPNFGDLVGPYLISKITGKPILNIYDEKKPGLMSVGSILQFINRENMVIWGTGLIEKPTDRVIRRLRKYKPEVLSVRGRETAKCLVEAGINIPDNVVFGDPALILPLFYKPLVSGVKKIGICPHYTHKSYFLENIISEDSLKIIDVQKDMEHVVREISSSTVCISTSLHGLIVAQAYSIPWVWLEVVDNNLGGEDFKFKDFFSTLNKNQVSHVKVILEDIGNINYNDLAKKASLPDKLYNQELILETLKEYLSRDVAK